MHGLRGFLMIAATAAAMGACAPATEQAAFNTPISSKANITVENRNWSDVVVYLVRGSSRMRLGTVTALASDNFRIPDAYVIGVSDITVQADPIGSTISYVSDPIQVYPGARIQLHVENNIRLSNFAVFNTGTR